MRSGETRVGIRVKVKAEEFGAGEERESVCERRMENSSGSVRDFKNRGVHKRSRGS